MSQPLLPDPGRQKPADNRAPRWTMRDMLSWPISFAGLEVRLGTYPALRATRAPRSLFQPMDEK
jgi:hypothetical protein